MEHILKSTFVLMFALASTSSAALLNTRKDDISALLNSINTQPRIAGGAEAKSDEFPYQVAIFAKGTAVLRCGGALVEENFVLTSAYCASLGDSSDIQVMVGNTVLTRESPSQLVDVERIFVHENYTLEGRKNDVAILQLSQSLKIRQPSVDVIQLKTSAVSPGTQCTFTGWGSDTWNGAASSVLKKLDLSIVETSVCAELVGQNIQADQICAAGREASHNACFLDEGGPLVCDGQLSGILSHSVNCGKGNKPSVYAGVVSHRHWIDEIIVSAATINSSNCFTMLAMFTAFISLWNSRT